ncbi:MAG TPA: AAA family ATPase [Clostridia bacterium]|nr:AAA family ATPase [Clostridia bacterium]
MEQSLDKIICLVGESGSGKTTLAMRLERESYNVIKSYTTRPPRYPNEWGHIFVLEEEYWKQKKSEMLAYTYFDGYHYWAKFEQYKGKGISLYIIDPQGVKDLKETVKDAEIVVIYLKVDQEERINRMIKAGRKEEDIKKRVKHDSLKFKIVCCDYVVDNNGSIDETLEVIKKLIKK